MCLLTPLKSTCPTVDFLKGKIYSDESRYNFFLVFLILFFSKSIRNIEVKKLNLLWIQSFDYAHKLQSEMTSAFLFWKRICRYERFNPLKIKKKSTIVKHFFRRAQVS